MRSRSARRPNATACFHWETAGAADIITKRGFKHTFQVGAAAYRYSQAAVDFTLDELAKKLGKSATDLRIALLWENRAFGKSVGDGIRDYMKTRTSSSSTTRATTNSPPT